MGDRINLVRKFDTRVDITGTRCPRDNTCAEEHVITLLKQWADGPLKNDVDLKTFGPFLAEWRRKDTAFAKYLLGDPPSSSPGPSPASLRNLRFF